MIKEINIYYHGHPKRSLEYNGPEGKVWLDKVRNNNMPNIIMTSEVIKKPNPNDSFLMIESITVNSKDYDINYLNQYKKIFSPFYKVFENSNIKDKIVPINYAINDQFIINKTSGSSEIDYSIFTKNWKSWENRINGVVIISDDKTSRCQYSIYELRNIIGNLLYSNKINVIKFGKSKTKLPYFKGRVTDKIEEICKYRFHLCIENTYDPIYSYNYFTEKLPHSIYGGAVPLYIGCSNIEDFVPDKLFIDLRKLVTKSNKTININTQGIINTIKTFSKQQFEKYQNSAIEYMKNPKGLFFQTDPKRYYKKMLETL
jgi:hypothetical protein